jgi:DNA-binding IclR family transcriptional regulator
VTPIEPLRTIAQRPLIELAATTRAHVALISMSGTGPIYLDLFPGPVQLPLRREPGQRVTTNSAAERALRSGQELAIDDGASINGVSCAAHILRLPHGEAGAVSVIVPAVRFPRELLVPLKSTANRITEQLSVPPRYPLRPWGQVV